MNHILQQIGDAAAGFDWQKLAGMLDSALKDQQSKLGHFNIIVAGRTGTGKSTLVNVIFGVEFAKTAMGRPVTQDATWYEREYHPLRILDTKGLEASNYKETWAALKAEFARGKSAVDPGRHIHVGWVCISEPSTRVEDAEKDLVDALQAEGIPTVVVLTKHGLFPGFLSEVERIVPGANAIIPVRALPMGGFPEAYGLEELVRETFRLVPDGVRAAFVASQTIDMSLKATDARKIIATASLMAGAAASIPLPFSDAITIVPIQLGMIVGISVRFGIGGTSESLLPLASSMIGCVAATAAGRLIVGQMLKLIPFLGEVNSAVAAALTAALGQAYLAFLLGFYQTSGRLPTTGEITEGFKEFWRKWDNKGDTAS